MLFTQSFILLFSFLTFTSANNGRPSAWKLTTETSKVTGTSHALSLYGSGNQRYITYDWNLDTAALSMDGKFKVVNDTKVFGGNIKLLDRSKDLYIVYVDKTKKPDPGFKLAVRKPLTYSKDGKKFHFVKCKVRMGTYDSWFLMVAKNKIFNKSCKPAPVFVNFLY